MKPWLCAIHFTDMGIDNDSYSARNYNRKEMRKRGNDSSTRLKFGWMRSLVENISNTTHILG
jgi:hypothetical protein